MDLLFKRYASPFLLVDQMLLTGQFTKFVIEIYSYDDDDRLWDIFLHKVTTDQSFNEWKASLGQNKEKQMTKNEIETTINDSFNILNGFEPTS